MKQPCLYFFILNVARALMLAVAPVFLQAQQVAVNTDGSPADPSAMLDVVSSTRGMLIPQMTAAERTGIASPATGLLIFDTDSNAFWFYNGTGWEQLFGTSQLPGPVTITPALLTASANDYNPAGFGDADILRLSGDDGIQMITGFQAGTGGEEKIITNIGIHPFYLAPEHSGSAAANRITYFEEVMVPPGASCRIRYDAILSRWRPLDPPCPDYTNIPHSVYYDKSAGLPPEGPSDDLQMGVFGPIAQFVDTPSVTSPFSSFYFNTGSATTGGSGLFYSKTTENMAIVGGAHIVAKMHVKTPSVLGDENNIYYVFLRLAAMPYSGFWNQNNSLGIRYRFDENGGKWQCYSRANNTDVVVDTGIPFEVDTEYDMVVTLNKSNTEATYILNGQVVGRITTNLPAVVPLGPSNHLEKLSGTEARDLRVYRFMGAGIAP